LEVWKEVPRQSKGKKSVPVKKENYHSKLFVRGDSVIFIIRNPK
jgi:small nuclear ribonucleoprotein D2